MIVLTHGDDEAGVCTLYPNGKAACASDADCGPDRACRAVGDVDACFDLHDPAGAPCDKWNLDCEGMCFISLYECSSLCVFTSLDYSAGYCAPLCGAGDTCPAGWSCRDIPGQDVARVCQLDAPGDDDGSPETATDAAPDAAPEEGVDGAPEVARDEGAEADAAVVEGGATPDAALPDPGTGSSAGGCRAGGRPADSVLPAFLLILAAIGARRAYRVPMPSISRFTSSCRVPAGNSRE